MIYFVFIRLVRRRRQRKRGERKRRKTSENAPPKKHTTEMRCGQMWKISTILFSSRMIG